MDQREQDDKLNASAGRKSRRRHSDQVRMIEVAALAQVSVMSVSRTIREPERVSPRIRARVEAAMRETGYVPNALASSLASQRTRVVALIVPFINASFGDTIQGITEVLEPQGYQLLIGQTAHSNENEARLVEAFLSRRVDGLILTGRTHTEATLERLRKVRVPVVETWNLSDDPIDVMVGFSNYEAARTMTRYLIEKGHKRIGYMGGRTQGNDRAADRERGYLDAMAEAGLECDRSHRTYKALEFREGAQGCAELLERHPDLDAIFAASDMLAVGAVFHCLKRGRAVPGDISIGGFDDADIASAMHPALTTVRVPRYEIGVKAAELLLERFESDGEGYLPRSVDLGFEVVVRDSA